MTERRTAKKWEADCSRNRYFQNLTKEKAARCYERLLDEAFVTEEITEKQRDPWFIKVYVAITAAIVVIADLVLYATLLRHSDRTLLAIAILVTLSLAIGLLATLGFKFYFYKMEEKLDDLIEQIEALGDIYPDIGNRANRNKVLGRREPEVAKIVVERPKEEEDKMAGILVPEDEDEAPIEEIEPDEALEEPTETFDTDDIDAIAKKTSSRIINEIEAELADSVLDFIIVDGNEDGSIMGDEDESTSKDPIYDPLFETVEPGEDDVDIVINQQPTTIEGWAALFKMLSE